MSRDLFKSAICQSGSSLDRWSFIDNPKSVAVKLAEKLNCSTNSSLEIVNCLKSKPAEDILKVELASIVDSKPPFGVVIEDEIIDVTENPAFMVDHPIHLYEQGNFSKVPVMITVNDMEGLLISALGVLSSPEVVDALNNNWTEIAPKLFKFDKESSSSELINWISAKLRQFYFGSSLVGWETLINLTNLYTDNMFAQRSRQTALLHARHKPVFLSLLGFKGIWSQTFPLGFKEILGMTHADDLSYLFTDYRYPPFPEGSESEAFSKRLVQLWVNFAKTGDPNYELDGQKWLPIQLEEIDSKRINWLYLKNEPEFVIEPLEDRMKLWDEIDHVLNTGIIPDKNV